MSNKLILEDSRNALLNKSKNDSKKSKQRYKRRVKSQVANTVQSYNEIDMNKLFKLDILTVGVPVKGETNNYVVKISFGGFLDELHRNLKEKDSLNLNIILRSLLSAINKEDVYVSCTCPDNYYRMSYIQTKMNINSGEPQNIPADITNPYNNLGSGCKHILLVLSNLKWVVRVSSTIHNYIKYMEIHYPKMYADIIYPAIYKKKYEEPVQLSFDDAEEISSDKDIIDVSNKEGRSRGQFKPGNTQGIRFASKPKAIQQEFTDEENNLK